MLRLVSALKNSWAGLVHLLHHETAFKQECIILVAAVPAAYIIAASFQQYVLLILMLVFIIIVEVLNTAVEAVCDALSTDFDANIKIAKDCGSLAVLLSVLMAATVWGFAAIEWLLRFS
ncbi:diacylglycerol kinase [Ahrensia kielensis]|uniref:diacylglycerol kinase n=1 Tax=Ahrensia kielensis TaxID=76980 RepID=UPI0003749231|nr:diacylglycerol kinase [Ahrensia kielensis]